MGRLSFSISLPDTHRMNSSGLTALLHPSHLLTFFGHPLPPVRPCSLTAGGCPKSALPLQLTHLSTQPGLRLSIYLRIKSRWWFMLFSQLYYTCALAEPSHMRTVLLGQGAGSFLPPSFRDSGLCWKGSCFGQREACLQWGLFLQMKQLAFS